MRPFCAFKENYLFLDIHETNVVKQIQCVVDKDEMKRSYLVERVPPFLPGLLRPSLPVVISHYLLHLGSAQYQQPVSKILGAYLKELTDSLTAQCLKSRWQIGFLFRNQGRSFPHLLPK